jgi:signal peptide peptidase SppA
MKFAHILKAVSNSIWAIQPEKLDEIVAFLQFASEGGRYTPAEAAERIGSRSSSRPSNNYSKIAVIPITGLISQKVQSMTDISGGPGGTSTDKVTSQLRAAVADDTISQILMPIDSPGGTVYGVAELAAEILKARGKKPIVAAVDSLAASAAYWLASAASEIVCTPSGEVGSIGVYSQHVDQSQALATEGVKVTLISAGEFKVEANSFEPLTKEAR